MSANLQRKLLHILTCFAKKYLKKTNKTEKAFILKGCAMNYKSYRIKIMNHLYFVLTIKIVKNILTTAP